jgi:Na+/H+ antiporter NhaD/arsenite permease-like protein
MVAPFIALLAAIALAALVVAYYLLVLNATPRVLNTASEYFNFIALIGSLFVVSGGIHINLKGEATPLANVIFLAVGALVANVLGTTGASMLLIRP